MIVAGRKAADVQTVGAANGTATPTPAATLASSRRRGSKETGCSRERPWDARGSGFAAQWWGKIVRTRNDAVWIALGPGWLILLFERPAFSAFDMVAIRCDGRSYRLTAGRQFLAAGCKLLAQLFAYVLVILRRPRLGDELNKLVKVAVFDICFHKV